MTAAMAHRYGFAFDRIRRTVRAGLIVGPHDPTQRFTYWPARVARAADAEPVLVHVAAGDPVQFIDARDLAAFVLRASDDGSHGPFNPVSAQRSLTMGAVLDACAAAAGTRPRWQWASAEAIERCGLKPWSALPLWLPPAGDPSAFALTNTRAATAAGLVSQPAARSAGVHQGRNELCARGAGAVSVRGRGWRLARR